MACDADLSAAPEAPFALMIDASARRVQESRLTARDLTLAIATFIWAGLLCASYCPVQLKTARSGAADVGFAM